MPWKAYQSNLRIISLAPAVNSPLVCFIEKGRQLRRLSTRFGNYLLQQNKMNRNKLEINHEQHLVSDRKNQLPALKGAYLCVPK